MAKSQSSANAAILIAIISALIILYIIFLPTDKRNELIGENESSSGGTSGVGKLLIQEQQIQMEYLRDKEKTYSLPSAILSLTSKSETLAESNSMYVKSSLFDKQEKELAFKVADTNNINNVVISFDASKKKGRLVLELNGHEIFNKDLEKSNPEAITVPENYIKLDNILKVSVSGVGMAFWSTNEYSLENLKILSEVTDISTKTATVSFRIPSTEYNNLESSEFQYAVNCQRGVSDTLTISFNDNPLFNSQPDCGTLTRTDVTNYILPEKNTISFSTNKATFTLYAMNIKNILNTTRDYTYYFDLDDSEYNDVKSNRKLLNLTFYFKDGVADKEADIALNGLTILRMGLHHKDKWSAILSKNYIESSSNQIVITPKENMDVRKLELRLVNK